MSHFIDFLLAESVTHNKIPYKMIERELACFLLGMMTKYDTELWKTASAVFHIPIVRLRILESRSFLGRTAHERLEDINAATGGSAIYEMTLMTLLHIRYDSALLPSVVFPPKALLLRRFSQIGRFEGPFPHQSSHRTHLGKTRP